MNAFQDMTTIGKWIIGKCLTELKLSGYYSHQYFVTTQEILSVVVGRKRSVAACYWLYAEGSSPGNGMWS
jgi:hypothetical protein